MNATKTVQILCNLELRCKSPARTGLSKIFANAFLIWSLSKYISMKSSANTRTTCALRKHIIEKSQFVSVNTISDHTMSLHERLAEAIIESNEASYKKLLEQEGSYIDKMTHAVLAIFFERWDYLPELEGELIMKEEVKLLLRLLCRSWEFETYVEKIFGEQTVLRDFTYRKTICFAAGAHGNRILCQGLASRHAHYVGYIVEGARSFNQEKIRKNFELMLCPPPQRPVQQQPVVRKYSDEEIHLLQICFLLFVSNMLTIILHLM